MKSEIEEEVFLRAYLDAYAAMARFSAVASRSDMTVPKPPPEITPWRSPPVPDPREGGWLRSKFRGLKYWQRRAALAEAQLEAVQTTVPRPDDRSLREFYQDFVNDLLSENARLRAEIKRLTAQLD